MESPAVFKNSTNKNLGGTESRKPPSWTLSKRSSLLSGPSKRLEKDRRAIHRTGTCGDARRSRQLESACSPDRQLAQLIRSSSPRPQITSFHAVVRDHVSAPVLSFSALLASPKIECKGAHRQREGGRTRRQPKVLATVGPFRSLWPPRGPEPECASTLCSRDAVNIAERLQKAHAVRAASLYRAG